MVIPWRCLLCEGCSTITSGILGFTGIVFCLRKDRNSRKRPTITTTQIIPSARRSLIIWIMGILNLHFFVHLVRV